MSTPTGDAPAASTGGPSWSPILTTLVASGAQGIILYGLFEMWRRWPKNRRHFESRRITKPSRSPAESPKKGLFGWIRSVTKVSDAETLRCVGLDTYMFLRFLRMCFKVTAVSAVVSLAVLIPVYITGKDSTPASTGYNTITMANIKEGGGRLWAPLIVYYFFVALMLSALWAEWKHFLPLRYKFLAEGDVDTEMEYRYTLLVENVPEKQRATGSLFAYFYKLFPGQVVKANMCMDTAHIEKLMKEREKAIIKYENAVATFKGKPKKGPPMAKIGGVMCCGGKKTEAAPHWQSVIERLNGEISREQVKMCQFGDELAARNPAELDAHSSMKETVKNKLHLASSKDKASASEKEFAKKWDSTVSSTGFVTFSTLASKAAADQCELSGKPNYFEAFSAPEPRDVIWENVSTPITKQRSLATICNSVWTLGILFWAVPVGVTQAIANLSGLEEKIPWLASWLPPKDSVAYGLLSGYLPVLLLALLMILLPIVISLSASKFMKLKSHSEVDLYVFKWHFGFQVANLWLILIGGSLFNQLSAMIEDVNSIVPLIGAAVPGASQFFLNYVITAALGALALELSGVVKIVILAIKTTMKSDKCRSQRELNQQCEPVEIKWGWVLPKIIFQLLVGMTYVVIVPVIEPAVAVYFGLAYLVWKHQALNVYSQQSEGGGNIYVQLYKFVMGCLFISEIIMIVYFGIKKGKAQAPLSAIPLLLTALFYHKVDFTFIKPSRILALERAREVDDAVKVQDRPRPFGGHEREFYLDAIDGETKDNPEGYHAGIVRAAGGYAQLLEAQSYAQPSLRPSQWETEPMPYRTDELQRIPSDSKQDIEAGEGVHHDRDTTSAQRSRPHKSAPYATAEAGAAAGGAAAGGAATAAHSGGGGGGGGDSAPSM